MKRKTPWSLTGLATGALMALGGPALAEEPVKIGMITTLSGAVGYIGEDIRDAFQLAMDQNGGKLGGVPVELLVEDDGFKPGNGRQIAEKFMYDEDVKILTGIIFSNIAGATVPDVVDNGAIYISPNAAPSNMAGKECHENYFAVAWQNDALHEATGIAAKKMGYKNAFALAPNYQAGKDAIAGFKKGFGGEIVGELYTQLGQTDYSAEMAQIRAANPEVVFQFHPGGMGIAFLRQYQQAGLLGQIPMVLSEPATDAVILKAVGESAVGINGTAHWNWDFDNEASKTFVAAWKEKYGDRPITYYASQSYDTALLIASALKETGGVDDIDALRAALRKADFDSVRGPFEFGPNQHPVQNWYLVDIEMGEAGVPVTVTKELLVEGFGDSYSALCQM
ncbi:ABC transporter substrate-binding protein [Pseudodonghicola flavimaris]|uniref:ABC transporter substrate-binding protein n=1 Tax=Pseudodonghicola flavimaris TaxID=3050036 RepID=A0ABT7F169_9RHOB|nr:ABC transporter substrate-binding protein [Pseudodonghicola flavimaris]MDK3018334.1 ABC transporter substrate-binding protein [Pseudodonghicola flavimaris]